METKQFNSVLGKIKAIVVLQNCKNVVRFEDISIKIQWTVLTDESSQMITLKKFD